MAPKSALFTDRIDRFSRYTGEALVEQLLWLIRLRWIAVAGIVVAALAADYAFPYPVLSTSSPIYICAGILLLCNVLYFYMATKKTSYAGPKDIILGMVQAEMDLIILTSVLHFAGGVVNPFFLFYIFHIIIATIILPKNLSYVVGLTAILLFGLLIVIELQGGGWFGYYPIQLSSGGGLWKNPVYALGLFSAFSCTVMLAQYLTRIIIIRMTAKEAEAARNNDLLKAVINAMSEGLVFLTHEGEVTICNPAAEHWKNNAGAAEAAHSLEGFLEPIAGLLKRLLVADNEAVTSGEIIKFNTSGSESCYIEAKSSSVVGIKGQLLGHVIVGQDLSEHKKLEQGLLDQTEKVTAINEMLKMTRIKMAQREKMVAIGQMATGIAHEIGNPLASLSSVVQYLKRKLTSHEEKEYLLLIESQIHRISKILKHMLSLSRPATSEYKWVDINDVIENTLSLVKFDTRMHSITVESISCSELPMVWLNPQMFEQVLLNIFINAMDAMNAKQNQSQHVLRITRSLEDKMIEIRICDNGIGMSRELCQRAFDSFFTTKEIGKGTGLGLFISYNLINEIDGTIKLESEPGEGTTVLIRIPIRPKKNLIDSDSDDSIEPIENKPNNLTTE